MLASESEIEFELLRQLHGDSEKSKDHDKRCTSYVHELAHRRAICHQLELHEEKKYLNERKIFRPLCDRFHQLQFQIYLNITSLNIDESVIFMFL
jgi:hypothetical protein